MNKFYFLFFFLNITISKGQSLSVISSLDTQSVYIGDVIIWSVKTKNLKNNKIYFPDLEISNSSLSVKNRSLLYNNKRLEGVQYELVFWDTGRFLTPEYQIHVLNSYGNIEREIEAPPIDIYIKSILPTSPEDIELRPLEGPVPVKMAYPIKIIISLIILLSSIMGMFWLWHKRVKPNYKKFNYNIIESPENRAKRRLTSLNPKGLSKLFYTELSHISREYMEKKFFVRTLEMTTNDIIKNRVIFPLNDEQFKKWVSILNFSDKVKYARTKVKTDQLRTHLIEIKLILRTLSNN